MMSSRERRALRAELVGVRSRIAEAKAELPKFARVSLAAYHQALDIVRMQEEGLAAIERELGSQATSPPAADDVVAQGTSLHGHTHKLVKAGTDSSGVPN